jgi:hypothetical protein
MRFYEIADALEKVEPTRDEYLGVDYYHIGLRKVILDRIVRALRIAASNPTVNDDEDADDQDGV